MSGRRGVHTHARAEVVHSLVEIGAARLPLLCTLQIGVPPNDSVEANGTQTEEESMLALLDEFKEYAGEERAITQQQGASRITTEEKVAIGTQEGNEDKEAGEPNDTKIADHVFNLDNKAWKTWLESADAYVSQFLASFLSETKVNTYKFIEQYGNQLDSLESWQPLSHPIFDIMLDIERAVESSKTILFICKTALKKYESSSATTEYNIIRALHNAFSYYNNVRECSHKQYLNDYFETGGGRYFEQDDSIKEFTESLCSHVGTLWYPFLNANSQLVFKKIDYGAYNAADGEHNADLVFTYPTVQAVPAEVETSDIDWASKVYDKMTTAFPWREHLLVRQILCTFIHHEHQDFQAYLQHLRKDVSEVYDLPTRQCLDYVCLSLYIKSVLMFEHNRVNEPDYGEYRMTVPYTPLPTLTDWCVAAEAAPRGSGTTTYETLSGYIYEHPYLRKGNALTTSALIYVTIKENGEAYAMADSRWYRLQNPSKSWIAKPGNQQWATAGSSGYFNKGLSFTSRGISEVGGKKRPYVETLEGVEEE